MKGLIALLLMLSLAACSGGSDVVPDVNLPDYFKADDIGGVVLPEDCPGGKPRLVDGAPAAWTLIHYAAGDNNLEKVLVEDINEMEMGHRGSPNVNVLVQLDRSSEPGVWRYAIGPGEDFENIESPLVGYSETEPDSGDWRTLAGFGQWAVTCYPAENYMLVIGGHGGGWSISDDDRSLEDRAQEVWGDGYGDVFRSIAPDNSHGSEITIDKLARALASISATARQPSDPEWRNRLVIYGSDACLMQSVEVIYDLRNTVDYLLGSEQTEPGQGWPYGTIIRALTERPIYFAQRPWALAEAVLENYGTSYGPGGSATETERITFAAVDTGATIRMRNRLDDIGRLLSELLVDDAELAGLVYGARDYTYVFGGRSVDVGVFLLNVREALISAGRMPELGQHWDGDERFRTLRDTIDDLMAEVWPELVLANLVTDAYPQATGISIFLPNDLCGYGLDIDGYARSAFAQDSDWDDFLVALLNHRSYSQAVLKDFGAGTLTAEEAGFVFEDLKMKCELEGDRFYLISREWSCIKPVGVDECKYPPELSFEAGLVDGALVVDKALLRHRFLGERFLSDLKELELEVDELLYEPGQSISGTLEIPFTKKTADGPDPFPVRLTFNCENIEARYCE
ncbi:MAG: hypothetical protein JRF33_13535 [Deltaproteobacteria bacterium]|nr:hypothetical protein [Deltaproteobacteria bacterium]